MTAQQEHHAPPASVEPHGGSADICLSCGLCCTGALFDALLLDAGAEVARMEQLGLREKDPDRIVQPCSAHRGGSCSIYAQRPRVCRQFRCELLRSLDRNALSPQQAEAIVARTLALRERALAAAAAIDPAANTKSLRTLAREFFERLSNTANAAEKRECEQVALHIGAVLRMTSTHFLKQRSGARPAAT